MRTTLIAAFLSLEDLRRNPRTDATDETPRVPRAATEQTGGEDGLEGGRNARASTSLQEMTYSWNDDRSVGGPWPVSLELLATQRCFGTIYEASSARPAVSLSWHDGGPARAAPRADVDQKNPGKRRALSFLPRPART